MRHFGILCATLALWTMFGTPHAQAGAASRSEPSVTWAVKVVLKGSVTVDWSTTSPAASGTLTGSGAIKFNEGSDITLKFTPNAGYKLTTVLKNLDPIYLNAQNTATFGPVGNSHLITVVCSEIVPTGTFALAFPEAPATLTNVMDITGSYNGVLALPNANRAYHADIAMDEFGKVAAMGNIVGIVNNPTQADQLSASVGSIKTVDNKPVGSFKGMFEGTVDGVASSGSGALTGPVEVQNLGSGAQGVAGTANYKGNVGDVPYTDSNVTMAIPLDATSAQNIKKSWSISLNVQSKLVKEKETLYATAMLTLPTGERISFPEMKTKYSAAKGYSLSFKNGTNITRVPNAKDKSTVAIKTMTMVQSGTKWSVTGGTIYYKFLGQKGQGNLAEFAQN